MLYLSAYLKAHQQEYYDRLTQVRVDGNFEAWVRFFLEGVVTVSEQVINTTRRLQRLEREDTDRLIQSPAGLNGLLLMRLLMHQPVVRVKDVQRALSISYNNANTVIARAGELGILEQTSSVRRSRQFMYREFVAILAEGTELNVGFEHSE